MVVPRAERATLAAGKDTGDALRSSAFALVGRAAQPGTPPDETGHGRQATASMSTEADDSSGADEAPAQPVKKRRAGTSRGPS
jgi:hypothetical protein